MKATRGGKQSAAQKAKANAAFGKAYSKLTPKRKRAVATKLKGEAYRNSNKPRNLDGTTKGVQTRKLRAIKTKRTATTGKRNR